jgi:WD40 repeat protein
MAQRYALVIGVSEYNRPLSSLSKTVGDAKAVAEMLRSHGQFQEIKTLTGQVTKAAIDQAVERLLLEQARGHEALLYFTGHAVPVVDLGAFLVPSDGEVEVRSGEVAAQKYCFPFTKLNQMIQAAKLSSLVVLLDCCHSGQFLERSLIEKTLTAFGEPKDYYFIAACRGFEEARARKSEQHSVFTGALLTELAGKNVGSDGEVTCDSLFAHLSRSLKGSGQEPLRLGYGRSIAIVTHAVPVTETTARFNPDNPYVGLTAFEAHQADYFHGRSQEVRELLARLDPTQTPPRRFLAVIGPSGSGKSSLVKAGLLPELRSGRLPGSSQWQIAPVITPGQYPKATLTRAIAALSHSEPSVLVIDQFEELFTLCQSVEEQREFLALLNREVTDPKRRTRVVITVRADFLDRCLQYPETAELINQSRSYMVTPLTDDRCIAQLEEVIVKPAAQHGVEFASGLVSQIESEVRNQMGAMPLLQFALKELWQTCIPNAEATPELTWEGYQTIGGVKGALHRRADLIYEGFTLSQREVVRRLVTQHLVQLGEDGIATRRRAQRQELLTGGETDQALNKVLEQLMAERLLVADANTIEVAHEALLSEDPRIRAWIEDNRDHLRQRDRFERNCREWQEQACSEGYLLSAGQLAGVEDWLKQTQHPLSEIQAQFLAQSQARRDRERDEKINLVEAKLRVERQRLRWGIGLLSATGLALAVAGYQWYRADRGRIEALVVASKASFDKNRDALEPLLTALEAGDRLQRSLWLRNDPQLQASVMEVLAAATFWSRERNRLEGHNNYVSSVVFSPDLDPNQQIIATASGDDAVKLWSAAGKELRSLAGHKESVNALSFSPDGQTIASADYNGVVKLWKRDGQFLRDLQADATPIWSLVFLDATTIATADNQGKIRIWNVQSDSSPQSWQAHKQAIYSLALSPDRQTIASAGEDGVVEFWNRAGQRSRPLLKAHPKPIYQVRWSDDGKTIATASADQSVVLWDSTTDTRQQILAGHTDEVMDVVFSPDGETIATASRDKTIKLWNRGGRLLSTLEGHVGRINRLGFSPDGAQLVSASHDKTVKLWQPRYAHITPIQHRSRVRRAFFSPDGSKIATADFDNNVILWNRDSKYIYKWPQDSAVYDLSFHPTEQIIAIAEADGTVGMLKLGTPQPIVLGKAERFVAGVSFQPPSGNIIAASSADKTVRFWSLSGQALNSIANAHDDIVYRIRYSPDGQKFVTTSADGTAKLWSLTLGENQPAAIVLRGHRDQSSIYGLQFSRDGKLIATAGEDNTAILWNNKGEFLKRFEGHVSGVTGVALQPPSGQMIATASDDTTIKLWQQNGKLITTLKGHRANVNSIDFSPDGKLLASASSDQIALLWDTSELTIDGLMRRGCQQAKSFLEHSATKLQICN